MKAIRIIYTCHTIGRCSSHGMAVHVRSNMAERLTSNQEVSSSILDGG